MEVWTCNATDMFIWYPLLMSTRRRVRQGGGFAELTYCDNMYQPAHIEIEVVLAETFWVDHNSYPYNLWSRGSIV